MIHFLRHTIIIYYFTCIFRVILPVPKSFFKVLRVYVSCCFISYIRVFSREVIKPRFKLIRFESYIQIMWSFFSVRFTSIIYYILDYYSVVICFSGFIRF